VLFLLRLQWNHHRRQAVIEMMSRRMNVIMQETIGLDLIWRRALILRDSTDEYCMYTARAILLFHYSRVNTIEIITRNDGKTNELAEFG